MISKPTRTLSDTGTVIIYKDKQGSVHREDGPAMIYSSGWTVWYFHGIRIRKNGLPAITQWDGSRKWTYDDGYLNLLAGIQ